MKKKLTPDFFRRKTLIYSIVNRIVVKTIQRNYFFTPFYHRLITKQFNNFQNVKKIHNFCFLTGRGRGIVAKFKMSRNMFKQNINYGLFYGFRKGSW